MSEAVLDSSKPAVALARIEESIRHGNSLVDGLSDYFDNRANSTETAELAERYKGYIREMHIEMVRDALGKTVALRAAEARTNLAAVHEQLERARLEEGRAETLLKELTLKTPDTPAALSSRTNPQRATEAGVEGGRTRRRTQTAAMKASEAAWQEGLVENWQIPEGEIPPVSILLETTMNTDDSERSYEDTRTIVAAAAEREPNLFSDDEGAIRSSSLRATVRAINTVRWHLAEVDPRDTIIEIPRDDQGRTRAISFLNPGLLEEHPPQLAATTDFGPRGSMILSNLVEAMTQPAPNLNELPIHQIG